MIFLGILVGFVLGLWMQQCAARDAYIRGWCAGAKVTVEDLIDFAGAEAPDADFSALLRGDA